MEEPSGVYLFEKKLVIRVGLGGGGGGRGAVSLVSTCTSAGGG